MRPLVAFFLLVVVLAAVPPSGATLVVDGERRAAVALVPLGGGFEGEAGFRFNVTEPSDVYAKLLPTPENPVHDGNSANGTAPTNASSGTGGSGWWVLFVLDQDGDRSPGLSFARADGTPTDVVPFDAQDDGLFGVVVHAPADAFPANETYTLHVVLAVRAVGSGNESGGTMDEALSFSIDLSRGEGAAPPPDGGGTDGGGDEEGTTDDEGDAEAVREERRRLPTPVLVAGAVVSLAILVGVLLLARR